jgi:hypothetical protein
VIVVFERAIARGELPADTDVEATFAALAGAIYFRIIVMGRTITADWLQRITALPIADGVMCDA